MKRFLSVGLILLLMTLPLSGCWSRKELNELSIIVGLGLDKTDSGYKVIAQIVNPGQVVVKKGSGINFSPVITYEEAGSTVPEALARMTVKAPRRLYFAHLRMLVIGEKLARAGISKPLDFISRNRDMRTDFYLVVAKNTSASELLRMYSSMDPIPANNLYTKLEASDRVWAATGKITLDRLIKDLSKQGKDPAITGIELVGNLKEGDKIGSVQRIDPPVIMQYTGMAAFKADKMVGWMDEGDTKVWNYLQNATKQTTAYTACPGGDGKLTMQIVNSHASIHPKLQGGNPSFDVHIRLEYDISDVECRTDLLAPSFLVEVKKLLDKKVKDLLEQSIRKAQRQFRADIYGFGDKFHSAYPKEWHRIKNWDDRFADAEIHVYPETIVRRIGTILQSVQHETED
ncbi:Ger(x)C family spore germination protein [Paenibacillus doosanensis]|uniref:Spore germination protein B3 n=1 Tax=Paenibacillus konkukensis TaxID=2020716 RepID=A0ABY4RRF6_9BACL|nr:MULTISPECIES: Ger(x)C family spore germination protein [Paenibacillus]MCS7462039.1 Ger(x)C family spore germination protein [Paenibacillus doosanensis]UQZ85104.1 Spore germination protein B3 precursor [Paenibacillus konkukensis]